MATLGREDKRFLSQRAIKKSIGLPRSLKLR
jgi:hypothetical protein